MGFAGMARVLTDKKAHSLIGLSTGSNIVRSVVHIGHYTHPRGIDTKSTYSPNRNVKQF